MNRYEKTPNLFERFKDKPNIGRYDVTKFRCKGFGVINPSAWVYVEKIDGMNMRLILRRDPLGGQTILSIRGRSNKAQIPGDLMKNITTLFNNRYTKFDALLGQETTSGVTLYGEGYGPGIQKGGGDYRDTKGFVLFDIVRWVQVDDGTVHQYYLHRQDVEDIGENCELTVAPVVFSGLGLGQLTKRVREGFASKLAEGERQAEGVVGQCDGLFHHYGGACTTRTRRLTRAMRRLKFKLKSKDFPI